MAEVKAAMAGTVFSIEVSPGEDVKQGQVVVILESMKMEIPIEAEADGKVTSIAVHEGDFVDENDLLVVMEPYR